MYDGAAIEGFERFEGFKRFEWFERFEGPRGSQVHC
jgi:hypothetical protein